ncbi:MAG: DEAD/DEAH box helicase [Myxococcota bacterium]|jgi:ATP-dependent RNA helicase DeaD|nr:DEAD/DEAH box helicase [Myxococcota bacterium]
MVADAPEPDFREALGPALAGALERKGYTSLTPVQLAVLDPALAGRDLRITSQTGSGKTLAIGFTLRDLVAAPHASHKGVAKPRALVVAPTRELAHQVEAELGWLFEKLPGRVASVTGGSSYRDESRALARGPAVIVGTPGRLLDQLNRGAIDLSACGAVVLDEADRMLDLGFREDLEAILALLPDPHTTHLVSATFPRDVRALADRVQKKAAHVEGTRLGRANVDIDHVVHVVHPTEKVDATVNLLLANPGAQTLIFARTRSDVADIAQELSEAGFAVGALSGDMDQRARNRALAAFKNGELVVLVATDVAARGIDVQDIARVIHVDVPDNADSYTHRSGRTGRAGRKGTSSMLVAPPGVANAVRLLGRANVEYRFEPIPSAEAIRSAADERTFTTLTQADAEDAKPLDARARSLAERLVAHGDVERTLARLLVATRGAGVAEARDVRALTPRPMSGRDDRPRARRDDRGGDRGAAWVPFHVSWGERHGADPRRLLALVCRRGGIQGRDVGAIRVESGFSIVDVASGVANEFERSTAKPDPRDPRVVIRRDVARGPGPGARPPHRDRPRPRRDRA